MAATDNFTGASVGLGSPATNAASITPTDGTDIGNVSRGLYIGGGGDLAVIMLGGQTVTFKAVPGGTMLAVRVSRVNATNTTATNIVAVW